MVFETPRKRKLPFDLNFIFCIILDFNYVDELLIINLYDSGVGATIGAGVYVLVGTVAREHAGPALPLSFMIAGLAAALSALCYAELASRFPSAGSAYHYAYICLGEGYIYSPSLHT